MTKNTIVQLTENLDSHSGALIITASQIFLNDAASERYTLTSTPNLQLYNLKFGYMDEVSESENAWHDEYILFWSSSASAGGALSELRERIRIFAECGAEKINHQFHGLTDVSVLSDAGVKSWVAHHISIFPFTTTDDIGVAVDTVATIAYKHRKMLELFQSIKSSPFPIYDLLMEKRNWVAVD